MFDWVRKFFVQETQKRARVPEYGLLYFDNLYSEYLTLKHTINNQQVVALLEEIRQKRLSSPPTLTWNDVYTFVRRLLLNGCDDRQSAMLKHPQSKGEYYAN